jgi:regulator of cell morphogenesis and NO signaling
MTAVDPATSLADLVVAVPGRAPLLERLRLDYCCGGGRSLAEACAQHGLDPDTVAALIAALDDVPSAVTAPHDVGGASIPDLCEHIVVAHHDRLRRDLPRISELLATVVRVHGVQRPDLLDLQRLFEGMRSDLEAHLAIEEQTLFPACRAAAETGAGVDAGLLAEHEADHAEVGEALVALRELSGGYESKLALCGTHRALLESLHELELETHQHVHEENNILFGRVRALAAS